MRKIVTQLMETHDLKHLYKFIRVNYAIHIDSQNIINLNKCIYGIQDKLGFDVEFIWIVVS